MNLYVDDSLRLQNLITKLQGLESAVKKRSDSVRQYTPVIPMIGESTAPQTTLNTQQELSRNDGEISLGSDGDDDNMDDESTDIADDLGTLNDSS